MGLLDDIMDHDAAFAFTNADEFAESVTYLPKGGEARAINAQVFREAPALIDGDPQPAEYPQYRVVVRNDAASGIASTEINLGGDKIRISRRWAESGTSNRVVQYIVSQDAGMMELALL